MKVNINNSMLNDSNTLDQGFYHELLHIMGLIEVKEGGKKLIQRQKTGDRYSGSLLENAIAQLDSLDKISRLENPEVFGESYQDQLFNIGLDLVITWVNRILFIKLLEAQLISYNQGDKTYSILNLDKIKDFDDLNSLFFMVLARKNSDRTEKIQEIFAHVPYLNSSLFEPTELEHEMIFISNLQTENLPIFTGTVLKDHQEKKRTGTINILQYLFEFLNAYDFSSEGKSSIKEDYKRLINASVLGLIFEKINGYQDGSFFTPGFITMYMCRETIRRAIIHKFNEVKKWHCQNIDDLYDKIDDKKEANAIINSLKICDPAVGSGHFLVSALNEIIAVKSELKILLDRNGKTLRDYEITVENDELVIIDDNGKLFQYNPNSTESQKVQETLFHEKQTIIENCLFGVDINPNSVKICRLRLWIELLKNAYYKQDTTQKPGFSEKPGFYPEMETLPNIDIKIKCGNSLISRFPLTGKVMFSSKVKQQISTYKNAVKTYFNTQDKSEKRQIERSLRNINESFLTDLGGNDPKKIKLRNLEGELYELEHPNLLFEETAKEKKAREKKINKLQNEIDKLKVEIEEIESGKIYQNAFEWRYEFPEVLNDQGEFIGFDLVIGNPPYGVQLSKIEQIYYHQQYEFGTSETAILFIKKGWEILNKNGQQSYIIPKSYTFASNYGKIREFTINNLTHLVDCGKVWPDVKLEVCIFILNKAEPTLNYNSYQLIQQEISDRTLINKELCKTFDFLINGLTHQEITLGLKLIKNSQTLNDISTNQRGAMIQKLLTDYGDTEVIGGSEVQKYGIQGIKGKVNIKEITDQKAFIKPNSILVQRIVAHIENPFDHIKITATLPERDNYLLVDTINQITLNNDFLPEFIWSLLHSKLLNWYVYRFVFAKAIRTMQFDNPTTSRIPIPKIINPKIKDILIDQVTKIMKMKKSNPQTDTTELEREIDQLVYQLYGLTESEIKLAERC